MVKLLIVGSLNMDMVADVDHTPLTGETILTRETTLIPGGKGANQAYAAGKLKADVTMLGAVGEDDYGNTLLENLTKAGVHVENVIKRKHTATGMAFITVNKEGDNSIVVISGANATMSVKDIDLGRKLIESADIVLLQMEIPVDSGDIRRAGSVPGFGVVWDCKNHGHYRADGRYDCGGRCFHGGGSRQICRGKDLCEAASFANRVASIVVTRKGAQSSIPTLEEVLAESF